MGNNSLPNLRSTCRWQVFSHYQALVVLRNSQIERKNKMEMQLLLLVLLYYIHQSKNNSNNLQDKKSAIIEDYTVVLIFKKKKKKETHETNK